MNAAPGDTHDEASGGADEDQGPNPVDALELVEKGGGDDFESNADGDEDESDADEGEVDPEDPSLQKRLVDWAKNLEGREKTYPSNMLRKRTANNRAQNSTNSIHPT